MVTESVMDCSLNHDNSNGSSVSNAGSPPPRPPGVLTGAEPASKGSLSPSHGASSAPPNIPSRDDMYHHRSPHGTQRTPSPQNMSQAQMHSGFDGRQHLGHLPPTAQLSPPSMMHPRMHLGPPGLGLFNSLVQHASPLDFMAAAHQQAAAAAAASREQQGPPRSYNSPPPISSTDPTANECKLVTYRGQKVAAFIINGDTMLCLPQAFELFLKHLVGGLHTVYTKLKRLDIVPLVCNVEQVRILRGLGAIQPGVNRCKLLSCKDFDALYRDCTTARCLTAHRTPDSSRPGRPPKRVPIGLSLPLQGHPQLKKHRLENGDFQPFENGHLTGESRLEKSPLLSNGYNAPPTHLHPMHQFYHPGLPHPGAVIKGQPGGGGAAPLEAIARSGIWEAAYEDIVKQLERFREERGDAEVMDQRSRNMTSHGDDFANGHSPVLNLSKGVAGSGGSRGSAGSPVDHSDSDPGASDKDDDDDDLNSNPDDEDDDRHGNDIKPSRGSPGGSPPPLPTNLAHLTVGVGVAPVGVSALGAGLAVKASVGGDPRLTSTETILRNIEGLLQVAADNARQQERQISLEKAELKLDVMREREVKESLERQLLDETRTRVLCQKRLKKVRRASRRLQEQLELEMKRRSQLEEVLRTTGASSEALRILTEMKSVAPEQTPPRSPAERDAVGAGSPSDKQWPPSSAGPGVPSGPSGPSGPPHAHTPTHPGRPSAPTSASAQAAFWQNYSESLAQELENERKSKQKQKEQLSQQPQQQDSQQHQHRQLTSQHDNEPIAMDLDNSKPLVQDLRWPTEHRAALIS